MRDAKLAGANLANPSDPPSGESLDRAPHVEDVIPGL
jgi:hypothetical protein